MTARHEGKTIYVVLGRNGKIDDTKRLSALEDLEKERGSLVAAIRYALDTYIRTEGSRAKSGEQ